MTDKVLKAQIKLFAIVARLSITNKESIEQILEEHTESIRTFIAVEVKKEEVENYITTFKRYFELVGKKKIYPSSDHKEEVKQSEVNAIKVIRICEDLNKELNLRHKYSTFIRVIELFTSEENISLEKHEFIKTLVDSFQLDKEETQLIQSLVLNKLEKEHYPKNVLFANSIKSEEPNQLFVKGLVGEIVVCYIESIKIICIRYLGENRLSINGNNFDPKKTYFLNSGSYIQCGPSNRIYQSDLLNRFLQQNHKGNFIFKVNNVSYKRKNNTIVQPVTTAFKSGRLVGILGSSGSGKTTFINLLNGSLSPSSGAVTINDVDLHRNPSSFEGVIGYVPQDDQLIEYLTVFENLYFTAKLCYKSSSNLDLHVIVLRLLKSFDLLDVKHLKVGNTLTKTISGGQRKRLNIALELIQNPEILFIDEPTSGLNSKGSLSIMNHLKELSFTGKLIFVVIHQPSSEIYKLFNRILLFDKNGFLAFDGKPFEALFYFKEKANQIGKIADECPACLNVKPENLFDIIESKQLDNNGRPQIKRKINPEEWYQYYIKYRESKQYKTPKIPALVSNFKRPTRLQQFITFFSRDAIGKIKNLQFLIIMLIQAPLLALILSIFIKDYGDNNIQYYFYNNSNIPSFFFVSVLVAIFFGMTMSAEEIFKDVNTLKRQHYMHLSWNSYLLAKMGVLTLISLIQSLCYTYVSSLIIELNHSFWSFWWVFFTLSIWANVLGLILSSLFRSTKVIYIIVTLFLIPQIIFSGMLNRFDKMHPFFRSEIEVPWIGNIMASRWANEALLVEIGTSSAIEEELFIYKSHKSQTLWKIDYWFPAMKNLLEDKTDKDIIRNEILKESTIWPNIKCEDCFRDNKLNKTQISIYLNKLNKAYKVAYNNWNKKLEKRIAQFDERDFREANLLNNNEAIKDLTSNKFHANKIRIDNKKHELIQLSDPIFQVSNASFLKAPLYSKIKRFFKHWYIDTFWANTFVIWFFTVLMYLLLAFKIPHKIEKIINDRK